MNPVGLPGFHVAVRIATALDDYREVSRRVGWWEGEGEAGGGE